MTEQETRRELHDKFYEFTDDGVYIKHESDDGEELDDWIIKKIYDRL